MNSPGALVSVVLVLGLVSIVALVKSGKIRLIVQPRGVRFVFVFDTAGASSVSPENGAGSPEKSTRILQEPRSWMSRHWRAATTLAASLIIIATPSWYWFSQPELWRMLFSESLGEVLGMLLHGSHEPLELNTGKATQDHLAQVMKIRIANLDKADHPDEIWIIDHYWRYWLSDTLNDYLSLNTEFVAHGGRIHRLFVLSNEDLADRDHGLEKMLRKQCSIAINSATAEVSSHFELLLAHPSIKGSEPYKRVAKQFGHLAGTADAFAGFDALQFDNAFFFSSGFTNSFDGSQGALDRSTWIFNLARIREVHLEDLFKAKNIGASEFNCASFEESYAQATGHASARL